MGTTTNSAVVATPGSLSTYSSPPALLTFLAPAERCNQRCPACLLEAMGEPITDFALGPADYARFLRQFLNAKVPVLSVAFQGYEVTLPASWPYVESVFEVAKDHDVRRGFVTNGMLLHKWTDRLLALDPQHVTISLDGACPEENDRLRGLTGAFDATVRSVRRTLAQAPRFAERMVVASTVYDEANMRSLLEMPTLLQKLNVHRWAVGWALKKDGDVARSVHDRNVVFQWLSALKDAADKADILFHTADDFGMLGESDRQALRARSVYNRSFLYRLDPRGYVRTGESLLDGWSAEKAQRWDPATDDAVEVVDYWAKAEPYQIRAASTPRQAPSGPAFPPG